MGAIKQLFKAIGEFEDVRGFSGWLLSQKALSFAVAFMLTAWACLAGLPGPIIAIVFLESLAVSLIITRYSAPFIRENKRKTLKRRAYVKAALALLSCALAVIFLISAYAGYELRPPPSKTTDGVQPPANNPPGAPTSPAPQALPDVAPQPTAANPKKEYGAKEKSELLDTLMQTSSLLTKDGQVISNEFPNLYSIWDQGGMYQDSSRFSFFDAGSTVLSRVNSEAHLLKQKIDQLKDTFPEEMSFALGGGTEDKVFDDLIKAISAEKVIFDYIRETKGYDNTVTQHMIYLSDPAVRRVHDVQKEYDNWLSNSKANTQQMRDNLR